MSRRSRELRRRSPTCPHCFESPSASRRHCAASHRRLFTARSLNFDSHPQFQPVRVLAELGNAEQIQLAAQQIAHIRLMNVQNFGQLRLRHLALPNMLQKRSMKIGLDGQFKRLFGRESKVLKNIASGDVLCLDVNGGFCISHLFVPLEAAVAREQVSPSPYPERCARSCESSFESNRGCKCDLRSAPDRLRDTKPFRRHLSIRRRPGLWTA